MRKLIDRLLCAGLLLVPALAGAAEGEPARLFAAPGAAAVPAPGSAAGIGQVTLALLVVLVAVFAVALLLKRLRGFHGGGGNAIEVVSQVSLGAKERAVIVRVGDTRLLLGVASGQVRLLHALPPESADAKLPAEAATAHRPTFIELLQKGLGK